jgi:hypothetical protein
VVLRHTLTVRTEQCTRPNPCGTNASLDSFYSVLSNGRVQDCYRSWAATPYLEATVLRWPISQTHGCTPSKAPAVSQLDEPRALEPVARLALKRKFSRLMLHVGAEESDQIKGQRRQRSSEQRRQALGRVLWGSGEGWCKKNYLRLSYPFNH